MIDTPTVKFTKKKFSDFERQIIEKEIPEEEAARIYVVGYTTSDDGEATVDNSKNVRMKLTEVLKAAHGEEFMAGTVIKVINPHATLSNEGYQMFTQGDERVLLFDTNALGKYIQIMRCDDDCMTKGMVVNNAGQEVEANILNVCFTGSALGEAIKLYLPDFGPVASETIDTPYALRLWKVDPRLDDDKNPFNVNDGGKLVFVSDPIRETPHSPEDDKKKYYDWFLKFIVLCSGVNDDGMFKYVARTSEVVNIFDDDILE